MTVVPVHDCSVALVVLLPSLCACVCMYVRVLNLPVMNDVCEKCNYHFEREPGYFIGAMYISYGFAVLQGVFTFLILNYGFPLLETIYKTIIVVLVITILGRKNYKLSRVLYIHIFPW